MNITVGNTTTLKGAIITSKATPEKNNGNHVKTDGADTGHSFKFFNSEAPLFHSMDHASIFTYRNEGTGQAADITGSHETAFFDRIVQHGKGRCRTGRAAAFQTNFLKDVGHAVTYSRRWGKGQVNDPELGSQPFGRFLGHELSDAGNLESCFLDGLGHDTNIGPTAAFESVLDNTRAGDTDMNSQWRPDRCAVIAGALRYPRLNLNSVVMPLRYLWVFVAFIAVVRLAQKYEGTK